MKHCAMSEKTKIRYKNATYELEYLIDIINSILHLEENKLLTYEIEDALLVRFKEIYEGISEDYEVFCNS